MQRMLLRRSLAIMTQATNLLRLQDLDDHFEPHLSVDLFFRRPAVGINNPLMFVQGLEVLFKHNTELYMKPTNISITPPACDCCSY